MISCCVINLLLRHVCLLTKNKVIENHSFIKLNDILTYWCELMNLNQRCKSRPVIVGHCALLFDCGVHKTENLIFNCTVKVNQVNVLWGLYTVCEVYIFLV